MSICFYLVQQTTSRKASLLVNREASAIKKCHENLKEYGKRPLKYQQVIRKPRGRFGRSKSLRSGHVSLTAMKRYLLFLCTIIWVLSTTFLRCFLSAGFPASSPSISGSSRATKSGCAGPYGSTTGSTRREYSSR